MKEWKKAIQLMVLATFTLMNAGCFPLILGAAAGASGVVWIKGVLEEDIEHSLSRTYDAVVKGLARSKLSITEQKEDTFSATVQSEYADGKKVWIDLKKNTERSTNIRIRVGVFGDKTRSESIMASIKRYL